MNNDDLGFANRGSSRKYYTLKSKGPETPEKGQWVSKFYPVEKIDSKWQPIIERGTDSVTLIIKGIEHNVHSSEQYGDKHQFKLIGTINEGDISIQFGFNHQSYGILNALCNKTIDRSKPIRIDVWTSKAKDREGVYYANAKVSDIVGNKFEWAYPIDKLPKGKTLMIGGKPVTDDTDVVEFWQRGIAYLKNQYAAIHGESPAPSAPQQQPQQTQPQQQKSAMKPNPSFEVAPNFQAPTNPPPVDFFADGGDDEDLPF